MSLIACGASRMSRGTVTAQHRSEISSSEIKQIRGGVDNAYDVVAKLRPWMFVMRERSGPLIDRGATRSDIHGVRVHIDDVSVGGIEMLRTVPTDAIVSIEWLSAIDATTRYGLGHMAGAITVTTGAHR